jgi:hypothetical protein
MRMVATEQAKRLIERRCKGERYLSAETGAQTPDIFGAMGDSIQGHMGRFDRDR